MTTLADSENKVMGELKDFQRATVERCFELYKSGQRRVLVADEVGLGKTLIAKGAIAKLARLHKSEGDDLFKVLYICSNASIANQNIHKLKIHDDVTVDGVSNTRLSMQHLKTCEQENDPVVKAGYIQLIPLTPATSFIKNGNGTANERALIFAILKNMPEFAGAADAKSLRLFLAKRNATQSVDQVEFRNKINKWQQRIDQCNKKTKGAYIREITEKVGEGLNVKDKSKGKLIDRIISYKDISAVADLRRLFAKISIGRLKPDFVIMDEFQRFRELITAEQKPEDTELGMLTHAFLKDSGANILLLSATPYKLYQTLEEAADSGVDEHYAEFLEVMKFLFDDNAKYGRFQKVWEDFSVSLREVKSDNFGSIISVKRKAEGEMYDGVCRTERIQIGSQENFVDDKTKKTDTPERVALTISDKDIQTFVEAEKINTIAKIPSNKAVHLPVEYVKSCPYPLSFMEDYKYKRDVKKVNTEFSTSKRQAYTQARKLLFVDENLLEEFKPLPANNARLEQLTEIAFADGAANLLWVPPSIPYYEFGGVFKGRENFSKIIVFSAWAMVPRMIASMLSYECERLTIGKCYVKESDKENKGYFAKNRYPSPKLETDAALAALTIPHKILADAYNPLKYLGQPLTRIKSAVKSTIEKHYDELQSVYKFRKRDSLFELYTNMAIASPAVCALRVFRNTKLAEEYDADEIEDMAKIFADEMVGMFNKPEATAVVKLAYRKSDDFHYENVLEYCVDGNFAAMLDEYAHILNDENPGSLCDQMCEALQATTASYAIDTHKSFVSDRKEKKRMRSHFAAGFYQTKGDDETGQRKEHLRMAFNAPFRPFVLATTSIGQEGLDFHNYARKIMHWNLPHNPIDIEQREGRINRYKCLAIRQSLAQKYGGELTFEKDVWNEIFEKYAPRDESGLVPYWCLPDGEVKIERYVPMYPYSKDQAVYDRLLKILSLYRVTLGQTRQEELMEHIFNQCGDDVEALKELFINLSPFSKAHQ